MASDGSIIKLGVLVPSSNTALEPLTVAIASTLPNISVHFARFPVTEISLSDQALSQFDDSKIIDAAKLLADAKVDAIGWSGTSAGWLGLDTDDKLCKKIEKATGIKATTSVIGLTKLLHESFDEQSQDGTRPRFGLVTPYLDDVQEKVINTFGEAGYEIVAESHLNRKVNVDFADITEDELDKQMEDVVSRMEDESVKIVSTFCTNLRAAQRVGHWENEYPGLIVADTVATVVWDMLRIIGVEMKDLRPWGVMFSKTAR
ncbi:Putative maleate isomerase/Arylmalonate decarboxylase [Septoria linicola]|uniref:Maleate isomerase/Arylmalonate decarboxylase n=1 Tax=Septoria linicola TaxID=215465 RepID=A0A9Q9AQ77_9PEZI|nr:putative maleate isomerase/Arylmalonate decarboxylase [Septoria linicola]USW53707.1 Putative maleate isomerase/Arylmalonate decarboxylase [Septoria linicola]